MKRKIVLFLLVCTMFMGLFCSTAIAAPTVKVIVDGKQISFTDAVPFVDSNNRTQVPMRALAEALGCSVNYVREYDWEYDEYFEYVDITKNTPAGLQLESIVEFDLYKLYSCLEGACWKTTFMDTAPILKNNRTYLPARYIAEAYGYIVEWDEKNNTVIVKTNPNDLLFSIPSYTASENDLYGTWKRNDNNGGNAGYIKFEKPNSYTINGYGGYYYDYYNDFGYWDPTMEYNNTSSYRITLQKKNVIEFMTNAFNEDMSSWEYEDYTYNTIVMIDNENALILYTNNYDYSQNVIEKLTKVSDY